MPLVLILGRRWGEYRGFVDHFDWVTSYLLLIGIFYLNISWLVPKIFYRGKTGQYLLALAVTIVIACLISFALHELIFERYRLLPKAPPKDSIFSVVVFTIILTPFYLISTAFKLLQRWVEDTQRIDELEKRALESELQALRSQIQPHFLFNMLNNILVVNKTDQVMASDIILKLSDFLRYLLYDSNENNVFLSQEIRFIDDFLALEQLRRDDFAYEIKYDPLNITGVKIPPHILLTLTENAAKHSMSPSGKSSIQLDIRVADNRVIIQCENSVPDIALSESGGLGLVNMRRRLELLYSDRFQYRASAHNGSYLVHLSLPV